MTNTEFLVKYGQKLKVSIEKLIKASQIVEERLAHLSDEGYEAAINKIAEPIDNTYDEANIDFAMSILTGCCSPNADISSIIDEAWNTAEHVNNQEGTEHQMIVYCLDDLVESVEKYFGITL